ncbi:MAG: Hsp70 family protein [Leptothrix sp. (in: b-proteobacteria)]
MKTYVGIDLGTTNSAISTFDGEEIKTYKDTEQNDVTPSAIFIDRRKNKFIGKRAYDNAARSPENAATGFKRFMGTKTPIKLSAADVVMTPEDCSAEILQVLYAYLPEEIRNDPDTGTVITVPAAFNQMQKDATKAAAESAGLGKIALMQEPVAAVMSVMRKRKTDGIFLVFDLGGGTLDIAIAQSTSGRVSLLAHGGIAMCGGRDFDRILMDNVVSPWLRKNFDLPEDFIIDKQYSTLRSMAMWATEKAKITLSSRDEAVISMDDTELRVRDRASKDIYLDIPLSKARLNELISEKLNEAITATRGTIEKAGLSADSIERMVFVGGPTQYPPLREKISFELGIPFSNDVNPMTAVAEGAAVFAESIDWSNESRGRKSVRGTIAASGVLNIGFNYVARTTDTKAKIVTRIGGEVLEGSTFQIDSIDVGTNSGKIPLKNGAHYEATLTKPGENKFKIYVFDPTGGSITIAESVIVITRTAAQVDAIPASHSIGVEAREKLGGPFVLDYLVKEGDSLPKKGTRTYRSDEMLKAGSPGSINFKLWEGSIEDPIRDNQFVGIFEIRGSHFSAGVIPKGAELQMEYEVLDSGNIFININVPCIQGTFESGRTFYTREVGEVDYSNVSKRILEETEEISGRIDAISDRIDDPRLDEARERLNRADANNIAVDPETAGHAMADIQEAKKLLALARKSHLKVIRQMDLDTCVNFFNETVRKHARPIEASFFDKLVITARNCIDNNKTDFENHLRDLRNRNWEVLFRLDWFVIDRFNWMTQSPHLFLDTTEFAELCHLGKQALAADDIDKLRLIMDHMDTVRIRMGGDDRIFSGANILLG